MLTHRSRTILGDIPADWEAKPLRTLITEQFAGDWGDDDGEQAVAVMRSTNFTNDGQLDFSDVAKRYFPKDKAEQFGLHQGDLLVERSGGGPDQPVGRIGFIERDMPGSTVSNFVQVLRPDPEKVDANFLGWALFELQRTGIVERAQQQSTQMRNLNWRDYQRLMLPWPEVDEQRRIAAALKLADEAIQKAWAELDAMRGLKKSLLNELLEKGLPGRHSSFIETKRMYYPESWVLTKLKKCGAWSAGGTPNRENTGYYEGSIPWVKSGEVNYSVIVETEEHLSEDGANQTTCGVLPVGTLLIAMYGAGVTRGRAALLGIPASTNQAVATFNGHEGIENEFIYYWFERNYERVRAWAAGSNQDNLSGYLLKNLQIALPDHDEQIEIVKFLRAADEATRAIQKRVNAQLELKRSLLQNLLTGKIRIPEGAIHA
ncbi:MAG: restriction endonuclease subunit S [Accumulibacter sp.]|jgi:type I restriction enzyme S subunit